MDTATTAQRFRQQWLTMDLRYYQIKPATVDDGGRMAVTLRRKLGSGAMTIHIDRRGNYHAA
jgi:hypothetical protein